ncbi:MAG: sulfur carrier protein ThiS [Chlorobiaceae bacterium]|nr:sulfur carrier protein ThiS [Chlorobiaceae bacterium]
MISITLNGQRHEVAAGSSISDLLPLVGADRQQVAVVANSLIVRPEERSDFILNENDEVDILIFAGGG